jgi:hypothetical protein
LFTYFEFFGSHYNSSVHSVNSRVQNMKSQYHYAYWKLPAPGLLKLGAIFLNCWIIGFLPYQLHVKGIVLYFWHFVRCFKIWIVTCYRGLKFPHRAVVLLLLERDTAYTSLTGHSVSKSAVLVVAWCYKARGDREQDMWRYWLPECCIKQWYDKPMVDGCLCKKCELGEQWTIVIAVSGTLAKHCNMQCENTRYETLLIHTTDRILHSHSR